MRKTICLLLVGALTIGLAGTARADGPRGPVEVKLEGFFDPDNTAESQAGARMGVGYGWTDSLLLGLYGSVIGTDRQQPSKMERVYGLGGYAEYTLSPAYTLSPYVGFSAGLLDSTGPHYPTFLHMTGSAGLKYFLSETVSLSGAATFHWADDDVFDYTANDDGSWDVSDTDFTLDAGMRFSF